MAVSHAVKTRKVGARLSTGDDVVNRNAELSHRQFNIYDLRAFAAIEIKHCINGSADFGIKAVSHPGARHADLQPLHRLAKIPGEIFPGHIDAR